MHLERHFCQKKNVLTQLKIFRPVTKNTLTFYLVSLIDLVVQYLTCYLNYD